MTRDEAIAAIAGRLVEYYKPERICLFGSEARGDAGPDSDLDFCVVVPEDAPAELLRVGAIYGLMGYLLHSGSPYILWSAPTKHFTIDL